MLSVNDNLSFKANIITKIKGRDNIMSKISQAFIEKSKDTRGTLLISRGRGEYKGALVCSLGRVKDSPEYFIGDYNKYFANKSQNVNPSMIDMFAERLFKVMQLLRKEKIFYAKDSQKQKEINRVIATLKANSQILSQLKSTSKKSSFIKIYETIIESNKARKNSLLEQKHKLKDNFIKECKVLVGEKDPVLKEYVGILDDII